MNRMRNVWFVLALAGGLVTSLPTTSEAALFTPEDAVEDWFFDDGNDGTIWFKLGFNAVLQPFELEVNQILVDFDDFQTEFGTAGELTGFDCVEMAFDDGPLCSVFEVFNPNDENPEDEDGEFPQRGVDYADGTEGDGPVNVGIGYAIFGFPNDCVECELELFSFDDPVDIGEILDFSFFTSLATDPNNIVLGHATFASGGLFTDNASVAHCDNTRDVDACAAANNFQFTQQVPEPGTILLLSGGLAGVVLRQVRRRRR